MQTRTKQSFFSNWHLRRWVALIVGIFFMIQAIRFSDIISGIAGAFFLFQTYTDSGCLVGNSCTPPSADHNKDEQNKIEEIEFTEIK
ncbi:hypothetical protein Asal01_01328 [Fodinibius salicampi]